MNTITILAPKPFEVNYTSMADIQLALMKGGYGNILNETIAKQNKAISIEIPQGTPKSRIAELKTIVVSFGLAGIQIGEGLAEWEKGGFGAKADWTLKEAMISRGVDISKPDDVEAFQAVIKQFQAAANSWRELKADGVVSVDGNFHVKKLADYRVPRSIKDR